MGQKVWPDNVGARLIEDILGTGRNLESQHMPAARGYHRTAARHRFERIHRQEALSDIVPTCPAEGESIHVVSDSKFEFGTWLPVMLGWIGRAEALYVSTWTASRPNAVDLFALWDAGKLYRINFLSGLYFRRRETGVYSFLLEGIRARGGRFRCSENHSKVMLLNTPEIYLTVEGSGNFTGNPRIEQFCITRDRGLHDFHRGWMEEIFNEK